MNPLNTKQAFELAMMNPKPSARQSNEGPVYRVSFEVERETWDWFMEAKTSGMVLACVAKVSDDAQPDEKLTEKAGKPYGTQAAALKRSGFCRAPLVQHYLNVTSDEQPSLREKMAWDALKAELGYDSMGDVPPATLREWAEARELAVYLPKEYR